MRLGLHVNNAGADALIRRWVDVVRPPAMKFLDAAFSHDLFRYCAERDVLVVCRVVFGDGEQKLGAAGARLIRDRILPKVREYPEAHAWELYNEEFTSGDELKRHGDLALEFMRELEDLGKKAVVFNGAVGAVNPEDWRLVPEALDHAARHGHYIGTHEYDKPNLRIGVGANQRPVWWAGDLCEDWGREIGWTTLRFARYVAVFHDMVNRGEISAVPNIAITESGIDDIQDWMPVAGKGYKDFRNHPVAQAVGGYAQDFAWYCRHLGYWPAVKFVVDFGFGTTQPEKWGSFNMADDPATFEAMLRLQSQLPRLHVGDPATPPAPAPAPAPEPVASVVGAAIEVVRGDGWWSLVRRAGEPFGVTPTAALVNETRQANPGVTGLEPGMRLWLPWLKVVRK